VVDGAWVYLVGCSDGSLYCGFARDVFARVEVHNAGRGARYTRSRLPVTLRWYWHCRSAEDARRLEGLLKRLTRADKLKVGRNDPRTLGPLLMEVARRRR
jgi:predicted GIY-YIG superfamily endonuclease